jgi:hypothetical protein
MTDQEKLKKCFEDVIWMASRYANGRSTYAPSMVRDAVSAFKEVYPEWEMRPDLTIKDTTFMGESFQFESDCLLDIYPQPTNK